MATVLTAAAGWGPHPNSDAPLPGSHRPGALIRRLPTAFNRAKEDRRGALAALGGLVKSPNGAQPAGDAWVACGNGEGRCRAPLGPLARQPARTLDRPPPKRRPQTLSEPPAPSRPRLGCEGPRPRAREGEAGRPSESSPGTRPRGAGQGGSVAEWTGPREFLFPVPAPVILLPPRLPSLL